jgi:hypothetical protein
MLTLAIVVGHGLIAGDQDLSQQKYVELRGL